VVLERVPHELHQLVDASHDRLAVLLDDEHRGAERVVHVAKACVARVDDAVDLVGDLAVGVLERLGEVAFVRGLRPAGEWFERHFGISP
jgi:hypothetical protein